MMRILQALCAYLAKELPDVEVKKAYALDLELEDWEGRTGIFVTPTESRSGQLDKPGQMIPTARYGWEERHNYEITFCARVDGLSRLEPAAAKAERIFPLFHRLALPEAEALCVGVDKPKPYFRGAFKETFIFISPHIVSFRRDHVGG